MRGKFEQPSSAESQKNKVKNHKEGEKGSNKSETSS